MLTDAEISDMFDRQLVTLTREERRVRDLAVAAMMNEGNRGDAHDLLAIIDRLTSPRAVLTEAERLLRPNGSSGTRVTALHWNASGLTVEMENDAMDAPDVDVEALADAYEALAGGG